METCAVEGCDRPRRCKSWCAMHYKRFKRYGDPVHRERELTKGPPEVRFWAKVKVGEAHECWPWTASVFKDRNGYGKFQAGQGGQGHVVYAHRYAYHLTRQMPLDLDILHSCDNPVCVNPAHLHAGTHADNMREMFARGRDQWTRKRDQIKPCGTYAGFHTHKRRGTEPCEACRLAERAYRHEQEERRRANH